MVRVFIYCLILILSTITLHARWATLEDSSIKTMYENVNINVNKDYTHETTIEFLDEILKEQGRRGFSKFIFEYDLKREKVEILEAYTIFEGKKYVVKKSEIEDKPLASEASAIAEYGQISIAFPKIVVGAKVYLRYKVIVNNLAIPDYFSNFFSFGKGGYFEKFNVAINSEIPLYIYKNDPYEVLEIKKKNQENKSVESITINQIRPFTNDLIDEPSSGAINKKYLTWVAVTSEKSWQEFHKKFIDNYSKVINQKLPNVFEKIYEGAKNKKNEIDQINYITLNLSDSIQYLMDKRSISGNVFPRDLNEVARTQYGDCKDFSFSTGAILKKLGYKVDIVLVYRGEIYPEFKAPIPFWVFNHMMLKVQGKNGNVYWLDPTNFQSMAGELFPDIADRMVLVISDKVAKYEKIPSINPKNSVNNIIKEYYIEDDKVRLSFDAKLSGQSSWNLNGLGKFYSKQRLEDLLFMSVNDNKFVNYEDKISSTIPTLDSRIVQDVKFKLEYRADDLLLNTNLGKALKLKYKPLYFFNDIAEDDKIDFYIDMPIFYDVKTVIKSHCIKNIKSIDFNIDTTWIKLDRSAKCVNNNTVISDKIAFKKSFIKNEEAKTQKFKNLKKAIIDNYINMALIIS